MVAILHHVSDLKKKIQIIIKITKIKIIKTKTNIVLVS